METRNLEAQYYSQLASIYLEGIATGIATFQTDVPEWEDWDKSHLSHCRIAAFEAERMSGWAALSPVSSRTVYEGVAEVSIYIAAAFRGKGIGKLLMCQLIKESEEAGVWTLQSAVFPNNVASIKLHKQCGFRQIGYKEKIGQKDGIWIDNIIMERRSKVVGV